MLQWIREHLLLAGRQQESHIKEEINKEQSNLDKALCRYDQQTKEADAISRTSVEVVRAAEEAVTLINGATKERGR